MRRLPGVALAVVAVAAAAVLAQVDSGSSVSAEVACVPRLFAGAGPDVEVIDRSTNVKTATITGSGLATGLALSPNGSTLYAANYSGRLSVIDVASGLPTAVWTGSDGVQTPGGIAVSPNGSRVFVANTGGNSLMVIDTTTNPLSISTPVTGLSGPYGVAVSPDGGRLFVSNYNANTVDVFDLSNYQRIATITVGSQPRAVAVSPGGSRLYVANESGSVSIVDTANNWLTASVTSISFPSALPHWLALSPDGSTLYVTLFQTSQLVVIRTSDPTVTARVSLPGASPFPVVVSPDGQRVYVGGYGDSTVWVLATSDNSLVTTIPTSQWSWGLAVDNCSVSTPPSSSSSSSSSTSSLPPPPEYTATGFFAPVRGGVTNTVQAGSNVPLKFRVSDGAKVVSSFEVVRSLTVETVSCSGPAAAGRPSIASIDLRPGLRYDATAQQFSVNWKTPKVRNTCYTVTATMADGDTLVASVRTR